MPLRRLLRGRVDESTLEAIASDVAAQYGESVESIDVLEADNWLSIPCVVNDQWFVKVISAQNSIVHGLLTTGRNLGVLSSGSEGFFEHFETPVEMAEHELDATSKMRELGINAPEPLRAFEHDGYGVLVLEYVPNFEVLDTVPEATAREIAPAVFDALARMHEAGLVHGDLRAENVLVVDGELYFIDATKVRGDGIREARAYDIACALAALEPLIGPKAAVDAAAESYDGETLVNADSYLDFVSIRPDHDFDTVRLKGEISKIVN
ncbi:RIO1 family regulatory kinase/ATPase [Salinibaculum rarum]|uniref:RIO1 family regulatory kinase/ATPase domain-containing protein n=1 Tax=Salinibaculum rarum TaxID=3058903 RepID=UPI00265EB468|nr:RIO1 family regulatory kinase/ATPase [Salinibaculum sp. KK48]